MCSRSIEKRGALQLKSLKKVSMTPLQNKGKRRISKQGVFRKKQTKIFHTLAHLDQVP
jgi:hypothetical protein